MQAAAAAAAGQWYPPVRSTLLLLSKLYRCIDTNIFAGLAQEAVAACTACVQVREAAESIYQQFSRQHQQTDCVCHRASLDIDTRHHVVASFSCSYDALVH
jgi:hypothetical protein